MNAIVNSVYFIWIILALSTIPMIIDLLNGTELVGLLHPTGELVARFMITTIMLTPLSLLFSHSWLIGWLL
jgi:sulfoxide reductase heme-binding subunit YedZ